MQSSIHSCQAPSKFDALKALVQNQFAAMVANGPLYCVELDRDEVWKTYLDAIPAEHRQTNACSCCKSFLRQFGGIVAIKDDKLITLWDFEFEDSEYGAAAKALRRYVARQPISAPLLNDVAKCGTDKNPDPKRGVVWQHFFVELPRQYVVRKDSIPTAQAAVRDNKNLLDRAVNEITPDAVATVLELISQGSLYRGEESKGVLTAFQQVQKQVLSIPANLRGNHCWLKSQEVGPALCRVRNSAIGTLLQDLTEGRELDAAVSAFERVVAPANYKRPTALVTPRMLDAARERLTELGLAQSIYRRLLTARDLTAANALHVHRAIRKDGDIFDDLKKDALVNPKSLSKVEEISIGDFLANVLPTATSVRALVENSHNGNFVSLVGPVHADTPTLFKWGNNYSWSYAGEVADSIKERVKAAGGNVTGILRISLSWHNFDDLDLHCIDPLGYRIYFRNKGQVSPSGGMLDVDMNAWAGTTRNAVENITWQNLPKNEGKYVVIVNQYSKRESGDTGFEVEMEFDGELHHMVVARNGETGKDNTVFEFTYSRKDGVKLIGSQGQSVAYASREKWGVKTGMFHQVQAITLSPNHWTESAGNKHVFFLLTGCKTDEKVRPFYNEFLTEELSKDRKVFELLGSKVEVESAPDELSGLGFSETLRNHLFVEVEGAFRRTLKVTF